MVKNSELLLVQKLKKLKALVDKQLTVDIANAKITPLDLRVIRIMTDGLE
jgi:hypothetical protein